MDKIPDNIVNKKLYQKAKEEADIKYKRAGLYKSAFIQKRYQELGGKYKGKKPEKNKGIQRWLLGEDWVNVEEYLKNNKVIKCGTIKDTNKACRPLKRVNKNTPITIPELLKIHTKEKLLELVKQKKKDMDGRILWKQGKFISSKK